MGMVDEILVVQAGARLQAAEEVFFYGQCISTQEFGYAPGIGYLVLEKDGLQHALGFYSPPNPLDEPPSQLESVVSLDDLPPDQCCIGRQGKGVGARLYNTPEGVMSAPQEPVAVGAYLFDVAGATILDARKPSDYTARGKVMRIASHAGRIAETIIRPNGLQKVTDRVHKSYKDADLVLMNQPPNPSRRQHARGYPDHPNWPSAFMIVRNPGLNITKVGEMGLQFFSHAKHA
jgi:hypothetical protein